MSDVSFSVEPGEVVGVIGRNGAGKSTLLKILSRITEPTSGRVSLRGRVASLLEVGTGFHPELTGRENIYLNGAILGMSRTEIRAKFDEIVAFAEVEKFLDTPVKRYSSGMYVRLAFSVAAHLDPEILIVDEVLGVGDMQFQKKCMGKMSDVASCGRTILFVSHNIAAIRKLCKTALLLHEGRLVGRGGVQEISDVYMASNPISGGGKSDWCAHGRSSDKPHFARISIKPEAVIRRGTTVYVRILLAGVLPKRLVVSLVLKDDEERIVLHSSDEFNPDLVGSQTREMSLDTGVLNVGRYHVFASLGVRNITELDHNNGHVSFTIEDPDLSIAGTRAVDWKGAISPFLPIWK